MMKIVKRKRASGKSGQKEKWVTLSHPVNTVESHKCFTLRHRGLMLLCMLLTPFHGHWCQSRQQLLL